MLKPKIIFIETVTYLFVFLFLYTAYYKIADHQNFTNVLTKSPSIPNFLAPLIAWAIPIAEIIATIMLIIPKLRKAGLYLSLTLMTVFTVYLLYMVLSGSTLPCNCGGVISSLTWEQHIAFNLLLEVLAITALYLSKGSAEGPLTSVSKKDLLLTLKP